MRVVSINVSPPPGNGLGTVHVHVMAGASAAEEKITAALNRELEVVEKECMRPKQASLSKHAHYMMATMFHSSSISSSEAGVSV